MLATDASKKESFTKWSFFYVIAHIRQGNTSATDYFNFLQNILCMRYKDMALCNVVNLLLG